MNDQPSPSSREPRTENGIRKAAGRRARRLLLAAVPLTVAAILGALAGIGVAAVIHMPRVESLEDFTPALITQLHDRHGRLFASYARERRVLLEEDEVPELLQRAILAAEDANFLQHGGVDAQGVVRAAIKNLAQGRLAMGGSTITQQLARQLFLSPQKTWRRKIEEALLAVELEKNFSKQQILTLYCNIVFLGHGNYGMEAAAQSYFGKSVHDLRLPEVAVLAGIPQRPTAYSPYRRPDLVLARRDYVLRRMREEAFVTSEEYRQATAEPLEVAPRRRRSQLAPYFAEDIRRYLERKYGIDDLLSKGLQVGTTLDPAIQRAAEAAVRSGLLVLDHRKGWRGPLFQVSGEDLESHRLESWDGPESLPDEWVQGLILDVGRRSARVRLPDGTYELTEKGFEWTKQSTPRRLLKPGDVAWFRLEPPKEAEPEPTLFLEQEPELEAAAVVLESSSGAVRALVGGWSFERSSFNRVTQARRQVGSAFKPFVYAAALESGFTAADTIFDAPAVFEGTDKLMNYSPRNFYQKYYGITTLRRALELSYNVSAVKLLDMVGGDRVIDLARRCGIGSALPPYPSLALGVAEVAPIKLAAAYATFANQGIYVEPYLIERVTTPDGRLLEEHHPHSRKAMEPEIAYLMTHILEGVIDRGTGRRASNLETALAGKTGTTDNFIDAWFVGYGSRHTALAWVGYDINRSLGRHMTGAEAALPIWISLIDDGLTNGWVPRTASFPRPPGVTLQSIELFTGLLPGPGAQQIIQEAFLEGTQPVRHYESQWAQVLQMPWYQQRAFYLPKAGESMPEDVEDWTLVQEVWEDKDDDSS